MFFLAEMPTVISPQHDERVVGVFAFFQSVQYSPDLRVRKADRRQVTLNGTVPLIVLEHHRMILAVLAGVPSSRRAVHLRRQLLAELEVVGTAEGRVVILIEESMVLCPVHRWRPGEISIWG